MASEILYTTLGAAFLLAVAYDVYATILDARARAGPISETLNRLAWGILRRLAFRFARRRRHRLLNATGPLLLPALLFVYVFTLIVGFGLIYYPHMPAGFAVTEAVETSPLVDSIYFSGVTLATVGYGDIVPRAPAMRMVALAEAATGFGLISLGVTYLITVYRALERKRTVALSFYHQAEEGADVAGFIAHHFVSGQFRGLHGVLRTAARDLQELLEAHVEHPIIHYFHPVEVYKSLPRVLFLTLEICTVIRSCLDADQYPETCLDPEVRTLSATARHVLGELVNSVYLNATAAAGSGAGLEESARWERRYRQTVGRLREAGIRTRQDTDAGWEDYRANREEWEAPLKRFASYLGYDWDEVTGDRDLRYAADEAMEEPRPMAGAGKE